MDRIQILLLFLLTISITILAIDHIAINPTPNMQAFLQFFVSDAGQNLIQNIVAVIAIVFAVRGVRNWNQERRDLRRADLAEQALAVAYRARDVVSSIRSPFSFGGEGESRQRQEDETPELKRARDIAFTQIERVNSHAKVFEEIQSLRYAIAAAFGERAAKPLLEFIKVRGEIIGAARTKYGRAGERENSEAMLALSQKIDGIIWEGFAKDDTIKTRLDEAVIKLEETFRPYMEASFKSLRLWRKQNKF